MHKFPKIPVIKIHHILTFCRNKVIETVLFIGCKSQSSIAIRSLNFNLPLISPWFLISKIRNLKIKLQKRILARKIERPTKSSYGAIFLNHVVLFSTRSIRHDIVLSVQKQSNVVPFFKSNSPTMINKDLRFISLTPTISKVLLCEAVNP